MGLLYDEADDAPTRIGNVIGSIIAIGIFLSVAALMVFAVWR